MSATAQAEARGRVDRSNTVDERSLARDVGPQFGADTAEGEIAPHVLLLCERHFDDTSLPVCGSREQRLPAHSACATLLGQVEHKQALSTLLHQAPAALVARAAPRQRPAEQRHPLYDHGY